MYCRLEVSAGFVSLRNLPLRQDSYLRGVTFGGIEYSEQEIH